MRTLPALPWDRANPMLFTRDAFETCYRSSLRSCGPRILIVPFSLLSSRQENHPPCPPLPWNVTGSELTRRHTRFFHSENGTSEPTSTIQDTTGCPLLYTSSCVCKSSATWCSFLRRESSSFEIHDAPC